MKNQMNEPIVNGTETETKTTAETHDNQSGVDCVLISSIKHGLADCGALVIDINGNPYYTFDLMSLYDSVCSIKQTIEDIGNTAFSSPQGTTIDQIIHKVAAKNQEQKHERSGD